MRVVVDTNVLVRAHARASDSGRALLKVLTGPDHILILSPFILGEVERVLNYPRMQAIWPLTQEEIAAFVTELSIIAEVVQPAMQRIPDVIPNDPDDDLATAVLGKADILCTLDRHLRKAEAKSYAAGHGFKIMTDVELLEQLRGIKNSSTP